MFVVTSEGINSNNDRPGRVTAFAPGRVNLIGDHTDTTGGLVLPMAIDLGTTITGRQGGDRVVLTSESEPEPATVVLRPTDPAALSPTWARYVAGVVAEVEPDQGFEGRVTTTLPVGAGLSSSAALEVAVALALGFDGPTIDLARLTQRAEQMASGVPCGIMDQLASAGGVDGHALLIDCTALTVEPVPVPDDVEIRVIHSGQARQLAGSEYAERTAALHRAEAVVGPLRLIESVDVLAPLGALRPVGSDDVGALGPLRPTGPDDPTDSGAADPHRSRSERGSVDDGSAVEPAGSLESISGDGRSDPLLLRRARHVVTENARVRQAAAALRAGDVVTFGQLMVESHRSLRDDFEVSTDVLDALVDRLVATPGVYGARLTGAGFGGCVVAVTEPGALDEGWHVIPSPGARLI